MYKTFTKLTAKLFLLAIVVFSLNVANAQDGAPKVPSETYGLGIQLQNPQDIGFVGTYAFNPNLHIGVQFGVAYDMGYKINETTKYDGGLNFNFSPFVRYYLEGSGSFKPFISGGAIISSTSVYINSPSGGKVSTTEDNVFINITAGAHWFPYKSVGVYGGFRFFEMDTDNSQIIIGTGKPVLGIDWWF